MLPKISNYHHFILLLIIIIMLMSKHRISATKIKNNTLNNLKSNQKTLTLGTNKEFPELTTIDSLEWPEFSPKRHTKATPTTTTKSPIIVTTTAKTAYKNSSNNLNDLHENQLNTLAYCFCDISLNSCDINCCCDPDCNSNILKTFQCLQDHHLIYQHQRKQPKIESCDTSDSWLCLFHSNVQKDETSKLLHEKYFDTTKFYTWPDPFLPIDDNSMRDFYKYGDPIQLINFETKATKLFELPSSRISSHYSPYCNTKVTVEHLNSFHKYCRIRNNEELLEVLDNLVHLEKSYSMEIQPNQNKNEIESLRTNIQIRYCYSGNKTCSNISNREKAEEEDVDKIDGQFQLRQINIKILHNYTQIKWCILELWFKETDYILDMDTVEEVVEGEEERAEDLKEKELWLQWNVEFHNQTLEELMAMEEKGTESYNKIISGPLGYLLNRPIIISTFEEDPNLLFSHKILKYFHKYSEPSAHIFKLFTKKHGKCYRPMDNVNTINYGINEILSCTTIISNDSNITPLITKQMENENDLEKYDFTGICSQIQNVINYHLIGDSGDKNTLNINNIENWFVSKLGRPQNTTDQWLPLLIKNFKSIPILGHYNEYSNTFTCHNMLLNINYEFHIITKHLYDEKVAADVQENTKLIMKTTQVQEIIERATLIFGQRHSLEFKLHELLEIPLVITTRFYNLNNESLISRAHTLITLYTFLFKAFNNFVELFISYF